MKKSKIAEIVETAYDWPLPEDQITKVYNNFVEMFSDELNYDAVKYCEDVANFSRQERKQYRNRLASMGFELRPDELDQYIAIIMFVLTEPKMIRD